MKFFRQSLLVQLVSSFSLLSLVTVSLVSLTAYQRARVALEQEVFNRLAVAVALKEFELSQWLQTQRQEVQLLARSPLVLAAAQELLQGGLPQTSPPLEEGVVADLATTLREMVTFKPSIESVQILNNGAVVALSSNVDEIGDYQGLGNTTTFLEPNATEFEPNIYRSPLTGQPTMTLAAPLIGPEGDRQGNVSITLSLETVDQFIRERSGLGETGETYLIQQQLDGRTVFVSGQPLELITGEEEPQDSSSHAIERALAGENGQGLYENYAGVPVIGVYRSVALGNLGLFAEISQAEAFAPAVALARQIFLIGLVTAGVLLALVYFLARQIVRPVLTITDTAARLEGGTYETTALDRVKARPDELGQLARVFQGMAQQIYVREQRLKKQVAELTIEIDQARKARQVAEITETSYFQELSQKAKDLRQRRQAPPEAPENPTP